MRDREAEAAAGRHVAKVEAVQAITSATVVAKGCVDVATATWTVPAARMKAGVQHRMSLAPAALALVQEIATLRGRTISAS